MLRKIKVAPLFLVLLLVGCASNLMKPSLNQEIKPAPDNKAQVVFFRSSFVGSAIQATLYDVTSGKPEFIGILSNGFKIPYLVSPGKHRFMVVSEAADFMDADLEAGKTYYSIITPRMGAWKARFSMWPVRNGPSEDFSMKTKDFKSWMSSTKVVENSPESQQWFKDNLPDIKEKMNAYLEVWKTKTPADLARRTMKKSDGVKTPY